MDVTKKKKVQKKDVGRFGVTLSYNPKPKINPKAQYKAEPHKKVFGTKNNCFSIKNL